MRRASLLLPAAMLVVAAACSGAKSHPYPARAFDARRTCLMPTSAVDVVEGTDNGLNCARKCLVGPSPADGGSRAVYISTQCPAYPPGYDTSGAPVECVDAVAAAEREDYCLEDGGSTRPGPHPVDAGAD
jgi:hypothetical protein